MRRTLLTLACFSLAIDAVSAADWQPAQGPLKTRWADDVSPDRPLPEYPRPQLVRTDWQNLNGLWQYAILPKAAEKPDQFDGQILVPFPVESALSGVMQRVGQDERLWYRRTFSRDDSWAGRRLLLHFGAVDWETKVWVNGRPIGEHRGGYDPFTFDITDALRERGEQEIVVSVWDPTDAGQQPRGKQVNKPGGIYYTPTSGIWQTVWLEPVPKGHIESLKIVPDVDRHAVRVMVRCAGQTGDDRVTVSVAGASAGEKIAPVKAVSANGRPGEELLLELADARLWSPREPWLYDLSVTLGSDDQPGDRVTSYFGMRKVSLGPDENGVTRIQLNNQPL
ncbi:MAG TPA: hypothetical protein PK867_07960, partial [Pirellulales bacterium]|nr:hypothetical protein [Pirellulales bacterium]